MRDAKHSSTIASMYKVSLNNPSINKKTACNGCLSPLDWPLIANVRNTARVMPNVHSLSTKIMWLDRDTETTDYGNEMVLQILNEIETAVNVIDAEYQRIMAKSLEHLKKVHMQKVTDTTNSSHLALLAQSPSSPKEEETDTEIIEREKLKLRADLNTKFSEALTMLLGMDIPIISCTLLRKHNGNAAAVADYYFEHMNEELVRATNMEKTWIKTAKAAKLKPLKKEKVIFVVHD